MDRRSPLALTSRSFALGAVLLASLLGCPSTEVGPPTAVDCSAGQVCPSEQVCNDGVCVAPCSESSCDRGFCDTASGRCIDCRDNTECPESQVCNAFTNLCVPAATGCTGDSECDGLRCDTVKGVCVDCINASDCDVGESCDEVTRTCGGATGCQSDFDCGAPTSVCDPSGVCVACFNDTHCGAGTCDVVSNTCVAGCEDGDETEPNSVDEGGTAVTIDSNGGHAGRICGGDIDSFTFQAEGTITATITASGGRLQGDILNAAGATLATGENSVVANGVPAGTYTLHIRGADDFVEGDYQLQLSVVTPQACIELDVEENDTNGTASALPTDGSIRSGRICGSDLDVWTFNAGTGDEVAVTVSAADGDGTLSYTVETNGGSVLATGNAAGQATVDSAPGGALFVRVRASGGDVGYSVRATTSAAPPVCQQTDAEPNDDPTQALALTTGTQATGQICAGDIDQWRFAANALDDLQVNLVGANVRARVFAADGAVVGEGSGSFSIVDMIGGTYRIEVRGTLSTNEGAYGLTIALTPEPVADPCTEGGLEPDSTASPRLIATNGNGAAGRICADDTDFYGFTLSATRQVGILVQFVDDAGDLDIRLKDSTGATVTSAASVTDDELIVRELPAGSYTVEIFGFLGALNTYTVSVTEITCTDDAFEPNQLARTAPPISGRAVSGTRCPVNDDFFGIRLENGDTVDARLNVANLTLSLVSTTGAVLASDAADGTGRRLQSTGLPAGRYAFRVTGGGTSPVDYTLTPTITPNPARCVDDGAEPNNSADTAFAIDAASLADGSFNLTALTMCDGNLNTDFFTIEIPANRSVRVFLDHALSADLDVEVLERRGTSTLTRSLARGLGTTTLDVVGGVINQASTLIVRVVEFSTLPAAGQPYTLGLEVGDLPNAACIDDLFDTWTSTNNAQIRRHKNDAITDPDTSDDILILPVPLTAPEAFSNMRICPNDPDVYRIDLTAGQRFNVDVTYVHALGRDIDLRIFGPDNANTPADADTQVDLLSCANCAGVDGTENFSGTAPIAGSYFIEVFGFSGGENQYELSVTTP